MIQPLSATQLVSIATRHAVLAILVGSLLSACSSVSRFGPDSLESIAAEDDGGTLVQANGRVMDGATRGLNGTRSAGRTATQDQKGSHVAAYPRDEHPAELTRDSNSIANRWRPSQRAGDQDGDGVIDTRDACPDTGTYVTVDSMGCGLFDAVLDRVVFDSGSRWLSARARKQLDQLAETLLAFPESRIQVQAHTDSPGSASVNLRLSADRAESVVQYLQSRGVHAEQLQALGLGETLPIADNDTVEGQLRNRRVEVITLPDQDAGELPHPLPVVARTVTLMAADAHAGSDSAEVTAGSTAALSVPELTVDSAEPSMQAARPILRAKRRTPPVMPLPEPGFAPGVRIAGVVEGLRFTPGSAALEPGSHEALDKVSQTLLDNPQVNIVVMAHTDDVGDAPKNLELSRQRARAVVDYLVASGVAEERLDAEGYGELLPLVQNMTETDRARNRRIEIRIQRN